MSLDKSKEGLETGQTVSRVYVALRTPILDGVIPPGTRINIDAIARDLGVSQTPVREALQRLETDDLLVYTPGRGYKTTPVLDQRGLTSLFEFRLLVEPWAARSAATNRLANPAHSLDEELREFERIVEAGGDVRQAMLAHDGRFHDRILESAGNAVVRQAFLQTHCHLHVFRLYHADITGENTSAEHREVSAAIRDCDADRAEAAMVAHIKNSYLRSSIAFTGEGGHAPLRLSIPPRIHMSL